MVTSGRVGSKRFPSSKMNTWRAGLVGRAEEWRWSSLRWLSAPAQPPVRIEQSTVPRGTLWVEGVNAVASDVDLEIIRESVRRDRPLGTSEWTLQTAKALNLEYSLRPRGRPRGVEPAGKDKFIYIIQTTSLFRDAPFSPLFQRVIQISALAGGLGQAASRVSVSVRSVMLTV